jgi:hypothetical protein
MTPVSHLSFLLLLDLFFVALFFILGHLQWADPPFAFAGPKNVSGTTSSGAMQSDRTVRGDANLA